MTNLSASDRKRLAAILSLLGSSASGERENAARLAEQFRNRRGLTWAELLPRRDRRHMEHGRQLAFAAARGLRFSTASAIARAILAFCSAPSA